MTVRDTTTVTTTRSTKSSQCLAGLHHECRSYTINLAFARSYFCGCECHKEGHGQGAREVGPRSSVTDLRSRDDDGGRDGVHGLLEQDGTMRRLRGDHEPVSAEDQRAIAQDVRGAAYSDGYIVNVLENARVAAAVGRFATEHPDYATPAGARDVCQRAAFEFMDYLLAEGVDRDEIEVVGASFVDFDDIVFWDHYATRAHDLVIDWTARQFYPLAPWPTVIPLWEWQTLLRPFED